MINQILKAKQISPNAAVYVDYENITELLKSYGKNPLDINFFPVILHKLREELNLNVIDFIVYGNFEKYNSRHQTSLKALGLETRHSSNYGKNSGDLELTVDALKTLYKNPSIEIFVIISSDRDIIPLVRAIKYEDKIAFVLSTRNGFNEIVTKYADHHEYIEDIFHFSLKKVEGISDKLREDWEHNFNLSEVSTMEIQRAEEVCQLFYNSLIWERNQKQGSAISLHGYVNVIAKTVGRLPAEIVEDFILAHHLQYITIYKDSKKGFCLKQGSQQEQLFHSNC